MKLTQKTLFQCFDRSVPTSSPVIIEQSDDDIIVCDVDVPCIVPPPPPVPPPSDFILPVHIRQDDLSTTKTLPVLHRWNSIDSQEINPLDHLKTFYRICPTNNEESLTENFLQFQPILSEQRQTELFQEYIHDDLSSYAQSTINWSLMFKHLKEYRKKSIEQNQYDQLPWTEIYRARHLNSYLGCHRKEIRRFNDWFHHWSRKLNNETEKPKSTRQGRKRRRVHDEDDDQSDEDFIEQSNLYYHQRSQSKEECPQIIFLHGCGTTSLVHALAEEHQFKITEINGTQSRTRATLLKQLEQSTSHHYLSIKRCPSDTVITQKLERSKSNSVAPVKKKAKSERGTITAFFNDKKKKTEVVEVKPSKRSKKLPSTNNEQNLISTVQVEKASLILFDEIETLTSDENFWSCLKKLLETAKKPIILTSNNRTNPDEALTNLEKIGSFQMIELPSNEPELIRCYLRLVLLVEMFEVSSRSQLESLIRSCSNDLRRCLLTLQFLSQSSSKMSVSSVSSSRENPSEFLSSQIYDTLFYANLIEQWTPTIFKDQFDDLTKLYRFRYERSSTEVFAKHLENEPKRTELYQTLRKFFEEQNIDMISDRSSIYLDYRPFIRRICQYEQDRAAESTSSRRLRHTLSFRGCSLQWSDYAILSHGL